MIPKRHFKCLVIWSRRSTWKKAQSKKPPMTECCSTNIRCGLPEFSIACVCVKQEWILELPKALTTPQLSILGEDSDDVKQERRHCHAGALKTHLTSFTRLFHVSFPSINTSSTTHNSINSPSNPPHNPQTTSHQSTCLELETSVTLVSTRLVTREPTRTLRSPSRSRRPASTRARSTLTWPTTPVRRFTRRCCLDTFTNNLTEDERSIANKLEREEKREKEGEEKSLQAQQIEKDATLPVRSPTQGNTFTIPQHTNTLYRPRHTATSPPRAPRSTKSLLRRTLPPSRARARSVLSKCFLSSSSSTFQDTSDDSFSCSQNIFRPNAKTSFDMRRIAML